MKKFKLGLVDKLTFALAVVGSINWGLDRLGYNLVNIIANATLPLIGTVIYAVVSISAIWVGVRAIMGKVKFMK